MALDTTISLHDLTQGEELSEEELAGVAGGPRPVGTYWDPPGVCCVDF